MVSTARIEGFATASRCIDLIAASCLSFPSRLDPALSTLFWPAALLCLVAQAMVVRSLFLGRTPAASKTRAGRVREVAWVILPALVLGYTLFASWRAAYREPNESSVTTAVAEGRR